MKSCNDKGKWEERREQSNGELGSSVRLCVEELTALTSRIAEGKKKQDCFVAEQHQGILKSLQK